jgi:hypothetical protein
MRKSHRGCESITTSMRCWRHVACDVRDRYQWEANVARDRELINPHGDDKRYVRRNEQGEFTDSQDDVGRSLRQDRRTDAEREVEKGQGDRGDQPE